MTYTTTYTPRVAMPRQDARVTATPRTEQEYARLLDALCRKEGKRGAVPRNDNNAGIVRRDQSDFTQYITAIRSGAVTVRSIAAHLKIPTERARYFVDTMKDRGMVRYNASKRQWEIVQ